MNANEQNTELNGGNVVVDPTQGQNPGGGNVDTSLNTERKPVQLKDDDLVEITIDGKPEVVPYKDARGMVMRHADYTRKTQTVAQERAKLQELFDGLKSRAEQIAEKEAAIDRILGRQPQNQHQDLPDDEVMTAGQVREMLRKEREAFQNEHRQSIGKTVEQLREEQVFSRLDAMTGDAVDALVKEHPVLGDIPNLHSTLKLQAREFNPRTDRELVEAILKSGKKMVERIDARYVTLSKEKALTKKKLVSNGPERQGGVTQFQTQNKTYGKGRKIDWNELENDVVAALENIED